MGSITLKGLTFSVRILHDANLGAPELARVNAAEIASRIGTRKYVEHGATRQRVRK